MAPKAGGTSTGFPVGWVVASTVAVPVIGSAIGRRWMAGPLELLRGWLTAHGEAVPATLFLVIAVVLIGMALGGWA